MSVKIRLTRKGAKKQPFYRIVVANSEAPRDGKFIEIVGTYDPKKEPAEIKLKEDKIIQWLKKGALPTDTVKSLFKKCKLYQKIEDSKKVTSPEQMGDSTVN